MYVHIVSHVYVRFPIGDPIPSFSVTLAEVINKMYKMYYGRECKRRKNINKKYINSI